MKKLSVLLILTLVLGLTACGTSDKKTDKKTETADKTVENEASEILDETEQETDHVMIELSNSSILVDGEEISEDPESAVYQAKDIIFYLEDQGIAYGAGSKADEHSQIEGDAHTVVHITQPGTYEVSGTLEAGQIFVDLGEEAKDDPTAVVNLILNNADITCLVAPAILFYNVYECAEVTDEEQVEDEAAAMNVQTTAAGANLILADDSQNQIYGSYVAKIYKSCELNEDGTEVVDAKKLHKYDGALYSKMSMNVYGDTGSLNIVAENEGLDTEMHLTILGGNIRIQSGNDGINVNEDHVSVFTMEDGTLDITVTGETGEGDGIDSNGWLVINGGTVRSYACAQSEDAGLDADEGVYVNGGTVIASGNMMSELAEGEQTCITFMSRERLDGGQTYEIKDAEENVILEAETAHEFKILVVSSENLTKDNIYTLWFDGEQIAEGMADAGMGMGNPGMRPDGEMPEGMEPPEGFEEGERPEKPGEFEGGERPEMADKLPDGEYPKPPEKPDGAEIPEKPSKK